MLKGAPPLFHQGLKQVCNYPDDSQVGNGTLLYVEYPYLNTATVEPGNGSARVQPLILQNFPGIIRSNIAIHTLEYLPVILLFTKYRFRNNQACNRWNSFRIVAIYLKPVIRVSLPL